MLLPAAGAGAAGEDGFCRRVSSSHAYARARRCRPVSLPRARGCILLPLATARDFCVSRQDSAQVSGQI